MDGAPKKEDATAERIGPPRVIVAGSRGCIGVRLVPELVARGCQVIELADASAAGQLPPETRADAFVNLAWLGSRGAARADYALQLDMVRTALDYYGLALRLGCRRYLCPGTIGERMAELPECDGVRSQNAVYVYAKATLRRMLLALERPECRIVWARLGNLYGSGDTGNLVNWTLAKVLAGEEATFGPARQPYEFVAIDDCAAALAGLVLAPSLSRSDYYVGVGKPRELREWLLEIGLIAGREELVAIGRRPDDGTRYRAEWFDIGPLAADTGYRPKVSFAAGVAALAESMKKEGSR